MLRASVALAVALATLGCGRDTEQAGTGTHDDAAVDVSRPDAEVGRSCPATAPRPGDACDAPMVCHYPNVCDDIGGDIACVAGRWESRIVCEPHYPTGTPCSTSDECDFTGEAINVCTRALPGDSIYPTPVCIGLSCAPGSACEGEHGLCLTTKTGGICLPLCTFGNDGKAPTGCIGKNMCWPVARADDASWSGVCFAGCSNDADCTGGDRCRVDQMRCVKTLLEPTKPVGAACDSSDAKSPAKCECLYDGSTMVGYCSSVCRLSETTCPIDYSCDPMMPDGDPAVIPPGVAGHCLKVCTSDADCVNSKCEQHAGMPTKTCSVDWSVNSALN